ncbi:hypothetical protein [Leucothrix mucor]|uniref:hypothetical protein n=1 Tax=Leucothrix mucor TaxID=45248 RepID=UPI0003B30D6D|nr:hypothetical protein [Leucothrix mucor]
MFKIIKVVALAIAVTACSEPAEDSVSKHDPVRSNFSLASVTTSEVISPSDIDEFSLIREESFGGLKLDMEIAELTPLIDCGAIKGEPVFWEGIGEIIQEWDYPECGVKLQMSTADPNVSQIVSSIAISAPSKLTTARGIHIGSSESEVMAAYADYEDTEHSAPGESFMAGSVYGGLIFSFEDDQVVRMFLGAGVE